MITTDDARALFRWILGQVDISEPEMEQFRAHVRDVDDGRRQILHSSAFTSLFNTVQGKTSSLSYHQRIVALFSKIDPRNSPRGSSSNCTSALGIKLLLDHVRDSHVILIIGDRDGMFLPEMVPASTDLPHTIVILDYRILQPERSIMLNGNILVRCSQSILDLKEVFTSLRLTVDMLWINVVVDTAILDQSQFMMSKKAVIVNDVQDQSESEIVSRQIASWGIAEPSFVWEQRTIFCVRGWHLPVSYRAGSKEEAAALIERARLQRTHAPKLAVGAIVKNESNAVLNMLRSIWPIASQIIVLDTGSTDGTVDIVDAFLRQSDIPHQLGHLTSDRFDVMRNAALDLVEPSMDWILMLDADEEIEPDDYEKIFEVMRTVTEDVIALPRYNYVSADKTKAVNPYPDRQRRLFRNDHANPIRYSGVVHETIDDRSTWNAPLNAALLNNEVGGPHIHHLVRRFRSPEEEAKKQMLYRLVQEKYGL
jgi:hypothetical protein